MIIALTGLNSLMLQNERNKLISRYSEKYGEMAVERLDGEVSSYERIQESFQSLPSLAEKKIVVLRSPSANKKFVEKAQDLLKELPDSTDVIIIEPKIDKRSSYYKLLKKVTDLQEYNELDESAAARWFETEAKSKGGKISIADAQYLIERIGLNQQLLSNELEKLVVFNANITRSSIELLCEPTPQSSIFELLEAAFSGNIKRAISLYKDQREQKVDTAQIIAMLTWQLRILALIKTAGGRSVAEIASMTKLNPFVVRKTLGIADRITLNHIKRLVTDLVTIDYRSKRENIDVDEAVQNYLLTLRE